MIKGLKVPSVSKKKFNLSSFTSQMDGSLDGVVKGDFSIDYAYNFSFKDGTLKCLDGLEKLNISNKNLTFPKSVKPLKIMHYTRFNSLSKSRDDRLIAYADDGGIYSLNLYDDSLEFVKINGVLFSESPNFINYKIYDDDVLLLSTKSDGLYVLNGDDLSFVDGAPSITSMCVHSERLFITTDSDENTLWFSDDFDFTNWFVSLEEAGYITLADSRGKMLKVFSFLNYLYVFREYGISRITAYGSQEDFSVENLDSGHGKIYENSITFCGNCIIFLATDGLYRFNGVDCVKILKEFDAYLKGTNNTSCYGVYFDGRLKLQLNANIDGKVQKLILDYNLTDKSFKLLKDFNLISFFKLKGDFYSVGGVNEAGDICLFCESGNLLGNSLVKKYKTNTTNFSIQSSEKNLYKLTLKTDGKTQIAISVDGVKHFYVLSDYNDTVYPNLKGENFCFEIISYKDKPKISGLSVYVSYLKEYLW